MKNPFKNFIAFTLSQQMLEWFNATSDERLNETAQNHITEDPKGGQWRTSGMVPCNGDGNYAMIMDDTGSAVLFAVSINDKNLPAKVRDEKTTEMYKQFVAREGRKPGKKEFAEMREDAENELLPKAFVKRAIVPVLLSTNRSDGDRELLTMYVFCSSHKRADDAIAVMHAFFIDCGIEFQGTRITTKNPVAGVLKEIACDGPVETEDEHFKFFAGDAAKLKGEGDLKRTITIKDRDIASGEVQDVITSGYEVIELRMGFHDAADDEDPRLTFTFNDKMIFKNVAFGDTNAVALRERGKESTEFFAQAWLVNKEYGRLVQEMVGICGGEVPFDFAQSTETKSGITPLANMFGKEHRDEQDEDEY